MSGGIVHRRGLALMIVLICTALLTMLMTSFMLINRANFSLSRRSDTTMRATQCCLSGLDYVRTRLQNDRGWATTALGTRRRTVNQRGLLTIDEEGTSPANNEITGSLTGTSEGFSVRLVNNLLDSSAEPAPTFSRRNLDIPPKSALVVVEGTCGSARRHLEVLLKNDFFSSSPLTSGADLAMSLADGDSLARLRFTTPLLEQNSVKSRGKTYMPVADRMSFGANPNSGSITGKDDVMLNSDLQINSTTGLFSSPPSGGNSMRSSLTQRQQAEVDSHSTILPSRDQRAPVLDKDAVKKPPGAAKSLPAGKYVFTGPGQVAYFSNAAANPSTDTPTRTYTGAIYDGGASTGTSGNEAVSISEFHFIPRGRVESPGSVTLDSSRNFLTSQLSLGYAADGSMTRGEDNQSSWEVDGDLTIRGNVAGNGALLAKGSGVIELQGKTQLAQSPDAGVAIYGEQSVRMRPPSASLQARSDIFDKNDFDFFRRALAAGRPSANPEIGDPQDLTEWNTPRASTIKARQQVKTGNDDQLFAGGLGTSPVIRDQGLLYADYVRDVLPSIPGLAANQTPLGRDLTAGEQATLADFLSECSHEGTTGNTARAAVTIGRHVRIKEFLRSCDRQVGGDRNWLTIWPNGAYNDKVRSIVMNLSQSLFEEAEKTGRTHLDEVCADISENWGDKDLPDVSLRGFVYSGGNFYASTSRSFKLRGTIASSNGPAVLENLHLGEFRFDQDVLEKLLDLNKIPLIPVNWAMDN